MILFIVLFAIAELLMLTLAANKASAATLIVDDDAPERGDGSLERPYNKIQKAVNNANKKISDEEER